MGSGDYSGNSHVLTLEFAYAGWRDWKYSEILLIANSIGAYLSLISLSKKPITKALLISSIIDMENLILTMMKKAKVSEEELKVKKIISTSCSEPLSWEYLSLC